MKLQLSITAQRVLFMLAYSVTLMLAITGLLVAFWNCHNSYRLPMFLIGGMAVFYTFIHIVEHFKKG